MIELGKLLNRFRGETPDENQVEVIMNLLKKIEFCYEPDEEEIPEKAKKSIVQTKYTKANPIYWISFDSCANDSK